MNVLFILFLAVVGFVVACFILYALTLSDWWKKRGDWILSCFGVGIFAFIMVFIIGGIIGIALIGWDKFIEKLKDWF